MKHNPFIVLCTICALIITTSKLQAQVTAEDTSKEVQQIGFNIFKLVSGVSNHFSDFRGDSITKMSGVVSYKVKNLPHMDANDNYIMVKPDGSAYYVAIITGDEARLHRYDRAFTYYVMAYGLHNKVNLMPKPDADLTTGTKLVYALMLNGSIKVGMFTRDDKAKRITIVVGLL